MEAVLSIFIHEDNGPTNTTIPDFVRVIAYNHVGVPQKSLSH
jgi:hypothetical protein